MVTAKQLQNKTQIALQELHKQLREEDGRKARAGCCWGMTNGISGECHRVCVARTSSVQRPIALTGLAQNTY